MVSTGVRLLGGVNRARGRGAARPLTTLLLVFLFTLVLSSPAPALRSATAGTTINVPGDQPTLQAAVAAAASGDTILLAPGTYQGGVFIQSKALTIASRFQTTGDAAYID